MEADAQKLYQLIWRQFVACQMTPAKYDSTTLTVGAGDFRLKARGRILRFDGWTKVMPALRKGDEDRILPAVDKGDTLTLIELTPAQHFTKPPARFSEASLVKELENVALVAHPRMRRSSLRFRIGVMFALRTVVSMLKNG